MCTQLCFGLCTDLNLSDKNLFSCVAFKGNINSIEEHNRTFFFPLTLVKTMGAVCAFVQGHVDDNEKSAGCPKSVVTLPSKYTCFSFPASSYLLLPSLC